ncbi:tRNA (adenosine(37)-N6)-threonylcarbamoyltransferase complex ATPase subunit type 1 TsaE [candidate division LCP-89 bacterium B3_LCP]|uniref:tRNA threonylcarbamoyladenosine biosynthesis protein TsaE n=1 Tax=candidate division LCP-89 bacterium B3_LCP TaxID=2012998 RepID=A0A532UUX5_UNCL8|nr:MAG: tRNA (adenosine(37)-N6)-threonylcarbamoyltransferase complex ATPase subunit type 1 TsaE [candidate division LCP-89 bacterium B3_LCP]
MSNTIIVKSRGIEHTGEIAGIFAEILKPGDAISLEGELGAGKTVFVKGIVRSLGYHGHVTSPTFILAHEYKTETPIFHLDCFRLRNEKDFLSIGFDDYLSGNNILLVEWGNVISEYFDGWAWKVKFYFNQEDDNSRTIEFIPCNIPIDNEEIVRMRQAMINLK